MRAYGVSVHLSQNLHDTWPHELDPATICFSVDVEWAHPVVLDDLRRLFDEAGIVATFFVTHDGVLTPGHERGVHPNFRHNSDGYQEFLAAHRALMKPATESQAQRFVLERTLGFAPEAKGVRTHSLYTDSTLLPMYRALGLQYDCSYDMPFVGRLRPFWKTHDILAIPIYYMDHIDIMTGATDFTLDCLRLDRPGLKVFDFHPNMVYLNVSDDAAYQASKVFYHDPERLLAARNQGRGVRTLLLKLIDHVAARRMSVACLDQINACWRKISHDADTIYAGSVESAVPPTRSSATCASKSDPGQVDIGEGRT
jgi:Polysaccharide deacetylase